MQVCRCVTSCNDLQEMVLRKIIGYSKLIGLVENNHTWFHSLKSINEGPDHLQKDTNNDNNTIGRKPTPSGHSYRYQNHNIVPFTVTRTSNNASSAPQPLYLLIKRNTYEIVHIFGEKRTRTAAQGITNPEVQIIKKPIFDTKKSTQTP